MKLRLSPWLLALISTLNLSVSNSQITTQVFFSQCDCESKTFSSSSTSTANLILRTEYGTASNFDCPAETQGLLIGIGDINPNILLQSRLDSVRLRRDFSVFMRLKVNEFENEDISPTVTILSMSNANIELRDENNLEFIFRNVITEVPNERIDDLGGNEITLMFGGQDTVDADEPSITPFYCVSVDGGKLAPVCKKAQTAKRSNIFGDVLTFFSESEQLLGEVLVEHVAVTDRDLSGFSEADLLQHFQDFGTDNPAPFSLPLFDLSRVFAMDEDTPTTLNLNDLVSSSDTGSEFDFTIVDFPAEFPNGAPDENFNGQFTAETVLNEFDDISYAFNVTLTGAYTCQSPIIYEHVIKVTAVDDPVFIDTDQIDALESDGESLVFLAAQPKLITLDIFKDVDSEELAQDGGIPPLGSGRMILRGLTGGELRAQGCGGNDPAVNVDDEVEISIGAVDLCFIAPVDAEINAEYVMTFAASKDAPGSLTSADVSITFLVDNPLKPVQDLEYEFSEDSEIIFSSDEFGFNEGGGQAANNFQTQITSLPDASEGILVHRPDDNSAFAAVDTSAFYPPSTEFRLTAAPGSFNLLGDRAVDLMGQPLNNADGCQIIEPIEKCPFTFTFRMRNDDGVFSEVTEVSYNIAGVNDGTPSITNEATLVTVAENTQQLEFAEGFVPISLTELGINILNDFGSDAFKVRVLVEAVDADRNLPVVLFATDGVPSKLDLRGIEPSTVITTDTSLCELGTCASSVFDLVPSLADDIFGRLFYVLVPDDVSPDVPLEFSISVQSLGEEVTQTFTVQLTPAPFFETLPGYIVITALVLCCPCITICLCVLKYKVQKCLFGGGDDGLSDDDDEEKSLSGRNRSRKDEYMAKVRDFGRSSSRMKKKSSLLGSSSRSKRSRNQSNRGDLRRPGDKSGKSSRRKYSDADERVPSRLKSKGLAAAPSHTREPGYPSGAPPKPRGKSRNPPKELGRPGRSKGKGLRKYSSDEEEDDLDELMNWTKERDPTTKDIYYFNVVTGVSSWDPPKKKKGKN